MILEPLASGEDQTGERPAIPDFGDKTEGPAGRRPPTSVPVIGEGLLTWTAERVASFPRDHKVTVGERLIETCIDLMAPSPPPPTAAKCAMC